MSSKSVSAAILLAAILSLSSAQDIPTPTYTGPLNAQKKQGCFSSSDPLQDHGSYIYQTAGNCQPICVGLGKPVMALVNGSNCLCGDLLPAKNTQVDDSECNTPCNGYDKDTCGGNNRFQVLLTGINKNSVPNYEPNSPSSTGRPSSQSTGTAAEIVTVGGSTVVLTVPPTQSADPSNTGGGGPNKASIAAGVVAGVVVIAGIIAGIVFFLRYKRKNAVEEEYRRQAAVKEFVGGRPPNTGHSSLADSRLDPEAMMRRESIGSLADNQDYSRRILKVTNPDGH